MFKNSMRTRYRTFIILLLLILTCIACDRKYKDYKQAIIGIWTRTVDESIESMPIGYKSDIRYVFYHDSANFYPGSYKIVADYGEFFTVKLITNRMDYWINKDRLKLKYLVQKDSNYIFRTEELKILKLNSDTLRLLREDSSTINFYRLYDVYE
jgi:hypothetical protein